MYKFDSKVRYSECDSHEKLTLASLVNYFQDCSTFQSHELGVGLSYMRELEKVWVLSSWQIVVDRYPNMCEEVEIGTFPYEFKKFFGYRNFFMRTKEGEYLAKANSLWTLLDVNTFKPSMPTEKMMSKFRLENKLDMEYSDRKIKLSGEGIDQETILVRKHHLDTNQHVNNGQYIDMAFEYLPEEFQVKKMRAEYKKQAWLDDVLYPNVIEENGKYMVSLCDVNKEPYVIVEFSNS